MSNQTPGATKARMSHNWMSRLYQVREKLKGRNIIKEITNSVSFHLPTNFKKNKLKKKNITSSDIYPTHSCNTCCYGDTRLDGC